EVRLGVDLHQSADVAFDVRADRAVGRNAARRLRGFRAALDAQQFLGLLQVAARFLERLLAFHHAEPGALAQFLDHSRRDFRHFQFPKLAPGLHRGDILRDVSYKKGAVQAPFDSANDARRYALSASSTSTKSSDVVATISVMTWLRPSRIASATP